MLYPCQTGYKKENIMIKSPFTDALSDAAKHIRKEISNLDNLDDIGIDGYHSYRGVENFARDSANLPYNARKSELAPAIAHQALVESFTKQLAGNIDPDKQANADKVIESIIKSSYDDPANSRVRYFDIEAERTNGSKELFGPLVDEKQKSYLLDGISKAPVATQQHLLNGIHKMSGWLPTEYNHIQANIGVMQTDISNAFKREGLEYKDAKKELFTKAFDPTIEVAPVSQVPNAMVATLMDHVLKSPELDRIGFNYIDMHDSLKEVADKIPQTYSEPMKMALLHQGLHEAASNQFEDITHTSTLRDITYKLDDLNAGLDKVARDHYSSTTVGYIPMSKIYSDIDNGPFPQTDDKEIFTAAAHGLSKVNNGARQLALALLDDHKNEPNYSIEQAVDLIKESNDIIDLRADQLGMPRKYNASEFEIGYTVKLSDLQSEQQHKASPMLRDIILLTDETSLSKVTGLSTADLNAQMIDFESQIPSHTDSDMHLGLLHHHLDVISQAAAFAHSENTTGQKPDETKKKQLRKQVNAQSFHIAHKSYARNGVMKAQPFLSKDAAGNYMQAPFSENLPKDAHAAMLDALSDMTQGQKGLVAQQLKRFEKSSNRGIPNSTANLVFGTLRDLDTAYQQIHENTPDTANKFIQQYDQAMEVNAAQERDKKVIEKAFVDIRVNDMFNNRNGLDKGTFPTFILADKNEGLKKTHAELLGKLEGYDPKTSQGATVSTQQAMRDFFANVEDLTKLYSATIKDKDTKDIDALKNQEDTMLAARKMVNEVALEAQDKDLFASNDNPSKPNATYNAYVETRAEINGTIADVKNQVVEIELKNAQHLEAAAPAPASTRQQAKP